MTNQAVTSTISTRKPEPSAYALATLLILLCVTSTQGSTAFVPPIVSFEQGCTIRAHEYQFPLRIKLLLARYITGSQPYTTLLNTFKTYYDQMASYMQDSTRAVSYRIAPTIHQIWLGSHLPQKYHAWQESWLIKNPGWTYILWTDQKTLHRADLAQKYPNYQEKQVSELQNLQRGDLSGQTRNYAELCDVYRYEILYQYGGVYADCDAECFQSFDILHRTYDFFAGVEPMECGQLVGNAIVGACAGHPIIALCLAHARSSSEPELLNLDSTVFRGCSIVCATGPLLLSRCVYQHLTDKIAGPTSDHTRDIILPTSFFYPCGGPCHPHPVPRAESFAAHYWSLSSLTV